MGRVILTTCGTSLLTSGCWSLPGIGPLTGLNEDDRRVQEAINKGVIMSQMAADSSGNTLALQFKKIDVWDTMTSLRDLPAELASLRVLKQALANQNPAVTLGEGDKIILLHSTNIEGEYCAKVLEKVLQILFADVAISPRPIPNLNPTDYNQFGDAIIRIWQTGYKIMEEEHPQNNKLIFSLTGGYKAVAMVLAGLAACHSHIPITIIYLHETAPDDGLCVMHFSSDEAMRDLLKTGYGDSRNNYTPVLALI